MYPIFAHSCFLQVYRIPVSDDESEMSPSVDWQMAQKEVMEMDTSNDPIQAAISKLEKQVSQIRLNNQNKFTVLLYSFANWFFF